MKHYKRKAKEIYDDYLVELLAAELSKDENRTNDTVIGDEGILLTLVANLNFSSCGTSCFLPLNLYLIATIITSYFHIF